MVYHRSASRSYWTLPGGGVESGETPEQATAREVKEETGLDGQVTRFLFDESFGNGVCRCFLMQVDETQETVLGYDPEESHFAEEDRLLQDVAWHSLESKKSDGQVARVLASLSVSATSPLDAPDGSE